MGEELFPERMTLHLVRRKIYEKGENPGEPGALYDVEGFDGGFRTWKQVGGLSSSWNGDRELLLTYDSLVKGETKPTAVVAKHGRLTGKAYATTIERAYKLAREVNPKAALGSVTVVNQDVTEILAKMVGRDEYFNERGKRIEKNRYGRDVAPITGANNNYEWSVYTDVFATTRDFLGRSLEIIGEKQKTKMRIWKIGEQTKFPWEISKTMQGSVQIRPSPDYSRPINREGIACVTKNSLDEADFEILLELGRMVRPVASNGVALGYGAYDHSKSEVTELYCLSGTDMTRVGAFRSAKWHAGFDTVGKLLAHDGFMPRIDAVDEAGIKGILVPVGGVEFDEVVKRANEWRIAVYTMKDRLFAHP